MGGVTGKSVLGIAAILIAAVILTLPAMLEPPRVNDSFWIDWVWLDQFARELGSGVVYPRWLPLSHGGLGSPVFYYYPPLAFYAGSIFVSAGFSVYVALLATFFAAFVLSGLGMFWWLRGQARMPLLGALIYMMAPYHVGDFYLRGALAEFMAMALLPFVMLGLRALMSGERRGFLIAAPAYGGLICSHLPLALLASLFLIGPYVLIEARGAPRNLARASAALATGVALAAAYLVPALALEPYRDAAKLWVNPVLQPQNWTFWNGEAPPGYPAMLLIGAAIAVTLSCLALTERSRWAMAGLAYVALGIGLVPLLWSLPLLRSVQFPFRIFTLAEFALATALAGTAARPLLSATCSAPLLAMSGFIWMSPPAAGAVSMTELQSSHPDVPENLPPGERPYSWPSRWALALASSHRQSLVENGATVEPVFYFPAWRVNCGGRVVAVMPAPRTQLLAHQGDNCSRTLVSTPPEKIGAAISALALLVLAAFGAIGRIRRLRARAPARKDEAEEVMA